MTDRPTIIFSDSLGEMEFIIMPTREFVKMITLLEIKVVFSAYNGIVMNDDFFYLIYDGIIFVPHTGNTEPLEKLFKIEEEGGFPDFFSYLAARRIEVDSYTDYKEFKNSENFGYERSNFEEFLASKKLKEE